MSGEESQDKQFDATPDKIKRERKKGNVALSQDANVLAAYLGLWLGIAVGGSALLLFAESLSTFFLHPFDATNALFAGSFGMEPLLQHPLLFIAVVTGPGIVAVVLVLIVQQAIVFAPTKIKPDLSRVNPFEGIKRRFGPQGMSEFLKSSAKIILATTIGGFYLWSRRDTYATGFGNAPGEIPAALFGEVVNILAIAIGISILITLVDVPAKRFAHAQKLRMSRQEVTDEAKENEGDPTQKQARRRRAKELATGQMLRDVPKADVVIVNPTHYAVALQWDRQTTTVPKCLAKGKDHLALAIIDRARNTGVPVREDPPCARALFATLEVGDEIQPAHFAAVAAAIRYADRVRPSGANGSNTSGE